MSPPEEVGRAEVLWLLGSLSGLYRLPFDANLVAQEFPPPYTLATFHQAARSLGLKTGEASLEGADWQKFPLPAIAFLRSVPSVESAATPAPAEEFVPRTRSPILLLKTDNQQLLYFRPGSQTPETLPLAEASQWLEPELILVAKEGKAAGEEDIAGFQAEKNPDWLTGLRKSAPDSAGWIYK